MTMKLSLMKEFLMVGLIENTKHDLLSGSFCLNGLWSKKKVIFQITGNIVLNISEGISANGNLKSHPHVVIVWKMITSYFP